MKYTIFCLLMIGFTATSLFAQTTETVAKDVKLPKMVFDKKFVDLGKVKKGEKRFFEFKFTNEGKADLNIDLISVCECSSTNQDDLRYKTYAPGESDVIKVTFDSSEKDESETIDIDVFLEEMNPVLNMPIIEMLQFKFELVE